ADIRALDKAHEHIRSNLEGAIKRQRVTAADADAALDRITAAPTLERAVRNADIVVEAIVEDLAVKSALFGQLDALTSPTAILATNTSSLSITRLAAATKRPARVLGMHFFNPVHIMQLVEIVVHDAADADVIAAVRELAVSMGKKPITV